MVEAVDDPRQIMDPNSFESQVREYALLKKSLETLEARQKELRDKLFETLDTDGFEDDKGNLQFELPSEIEGIVRIEKQRRVSRKLNEAKAEEIIDAAGLGVDLYEFKRVINEDALMAAFYENKITEDELDDMFPATVTWALRTLKK
jgi:hypothetical protein